VHQIQRRHVLQVCRHRRRELSPRFPRARGRRVGGWVTGCVALAHLDFVGVLLGFCDVTTGRRWPRCLRTT
jgi:hypothetical protein